MPKILILFAGQPTAIVSAVADGARSIRFSEVELRRLDNADFANAANRIDIYPTLAGADEIVPYDAVIVVASAGEDVQAGPSQLLKQAAASAPPSAWQNKVGAAFASDAEAGPAGVWPTLQALGDLGLLLVSPSGSDAVAAKELGARVAQVVGWVTHSRSHHHHAH
jgi:hypothetical protein